MLQTLALCAILATTTVGRFPLIDIPDYEIVWRSPAGSKFEAEAQRRVKDRLGKIVITAEYFLKHMPIVR